MVRRMDVQVASILLNFLEQQQSAGCQRPDEDSSKSRNRMSLGSLIGVPYLELHVW